MNKKKVLNTLVTAATTGAIVLSSAFASTVLSITDSTNQKSHNSVVKDMKSLNVDTGVVDNLVYNNKFSDRYIRLQIDEGKPVIIDILDKKTEDKKEILQDIVNYYNKIFKTINEDYSFKIKDENTKVSLTDTVIYVGDKISSSQFLGGFMGLYTPDLGEGCFVSGAYIQMNWESIEEYDDSNDLAKYVLLHEIGHCLGLGDVYYKGKNKVCDYINYNTIMHRTDKNRILALYPNDYALLQSLYSKEYEKCGNYEEAVKIMKKKIETYTYNFYYAYANKLKEKGMSEIDLNIEDLPRNLTFEGYNICEVNFLENNKCQLIIRNEEGKILESVIGDVLTANGVIFIRNIYFNNVSNYECTADSVGIKLMLSISISKEGNLIMNNSTHSRSSTYTCKMLDNKKENNLSQR